MFLIPSLVLLVSWVCSCSRPSRRPGWRPWRRPPPVLATLLTINLSCSWAGGCSPSARRSSTRADRAHGSSRHRRASPILRAARRRPARAAAYRYGTAFGDTFARIFDRPRAVSRATARRKPLTGPGARRAAQRPAGRHRQDPVPERRRCHRHDDGRFDRPGREDRVSMVSMPRDLIDVPLGNGDGTGRSSTPCFAYADRHPDEFPDGGSRALEDAIGALLGIEIHYYARDRLLYGFRDMIDAVGGIDIDVTQGFDDPDLRRLRVRSMGYAITAGRIISTARRRSPTSARARAGGESDFTRAARQQQVLVALRDAVTQGRFAAVGAAGAAGRRRRCGAAPTCRRRACRSWPRVSTRSMTTRSIARDHPPSAGAIRRHPLRIVARARPGRDPRGRRRGCSRSPARTRRRGRPRSRRPNPGGRAGRRAGSRTVGRGRRSEPERGQPAAMRRAARARCEIAFFSAGVHSPRVRPPGGSDLRLEDRVVAEPAGPARRTRRSGRDTSPART